jgi:MFS family permease
VFNKLNSELKRNLLVLFTAGLLFWSSIASLLPGTPLYIEHIGGTKQEIGIVMGSFAIGLLLFRPSLGKMADSRGRKIVLLIGVIVVAIAPLGYILVSSIPLLMALRAFHGISIAAFTTAYAAFVTDIAPSENRGEIVGYMSLVNPIGMAIGPAMGGYLQSYFGYTALFLNSSAIGFIALICALQLKNPKLPGQQRQQSQDNSFWRMLFSPRVKVPAMVMLLIGLAFGALSTFVPLYIKSSNIDLNPGLFYTAAAISSFCIRIVTGRISDRLGRGLFVTFGITCYSMSMVLLWLADSASAFLIAGLVEGMGGGTMIPMIMTMMADRSHPYERGRIFALCVTGFDVGIAVAGPVFGSVGDKLGYRVMFAYAAGLTFLAILIFLTQSAQGLINSIKFALGRGEDSYALK